MRGPRRSAVEGVQSQTRRLSRQFGANLPLLIFINKIDRLGARSDSLLDDIRRKLKLRVVGDDSAQGSATGQLRSSPTTVPARPGEIR